MSITARFAPQLLAFLGIRLLKADAYCLRCFDQLAAGNFQQTTVHWMGHRLFLHGGIHNHSLKLAEGIAHLPAHQRPVLHGDNGSAFKATTVLAMLHWLGIKPSYSRPRVSDDNAFVESLFRTAKYRPEYPAHGFCDLASARQWAAEFVHWYNHEHRHSGIQFVTPHQRHTGKDKAILAHRHQVYGQAKQNRPARWSRHTRNWQPIEAVALNPERAESITQKIRLAA